MIPIVILTGGLSWISYINEENENDASSDCKICKMNSSRILFGLLACALLSSAFETEVEGDNYIVGGRIAKRGLFPWIVSLRSVENRHFSGGFILSKNWVGTAAYGVRYLHNTPNKIIAVTGAHTLTDGTRHRVIRVIIHPRFNMRILAFNVAVIQTASNIEFNDRARPITFPEGPVVSTGTLSLIAGWGATDVSNTICMINQYRKTFTALSWILIHDWF